MSTRERILLGLATWAVVAGLSWASGRHWFEAASSGAIVGWLAAWLLVPREI